MIQCRDGKNQQILGSVLAKTWILARFILSGFGFFPISTPMHGQQLAVAPSGECQYSGDAIGTHRHLHFELCNLWTQNQTRVPHHHHVNHIRWSQVQPVFTDHVARQVTYTATDWDRRYVIIRT